MGRNPLLPFWGSHITTAAGLRGLVPLFHAPGTLPETEPVRGFRQGPFARELRIGG